MAIFREFVHQKRDRSAGDRTRHKDLVKKKIREGIADIIAEESIIAKSRNKIIKVPIKGIKEFQFVFGENGKGVSQGTGGEHKGQTLNRSKEQNRSKAGEAGNQPGEDIYETEITVDEAINMMFEDLELPALEKKRYFEVESESMRKLMGYQRKGIRTRLSKKRTIKNKLKRKSAQKKRGNVEEPFPFHNDDLVFRRLVTDVKPQSNAVVFCIMDVSGSMDQVKKYLARSFYFMLYHFIKTRYRTTEIIFIAHHTEAKEVSENDFFHRVESGGTFISSGYLKTLEIIDERYNPAVWNIYAFHCSDGDNFDSDNKAALEAAQKLADLCNLFGYGEIKPVSSYSWSSMIDRYSQIQAENFVSLKIRGKEDIWPAFKKFLTLDKTAVPEN